MNDFNKIKKKLEPRTKKIKKLKCQAVDGMLVCDVSLKDETFSERVDIDTLTVYPAGTCELGRHQWGENFILCYGNR